MKTVKSKLEVKQNQLVAVCLFMYFAMMAAKQIFTAEVVEIIDVFQTTASKVSLANLLYYLTYAIMQVVLIFFIDKIRLKTYLFITAGLSAIFTILIGIIGTLGVSIIYLFVIFALNGILQAGIYGCSVKLFNKYLTKQQSFNAIKLIQLGQSVAMILSYSVSAYFVSISKWEMPFIIIGLLFLISAIVFYISVSSITRYIRENRPISEYDTVQVEDKGAAPNAQVKKLLFTFLIIVCVMSVFNYCAYYGLNGWISKLLYDEYNVDKAYSILISVGINILISIFTIVGINVALKLKNCLHLTVFSSCASVVFALVLTFFFRLSAVLTMLLCLLYMIMNKVGASAFSSITAYKLRAIIEPGKYSFLSNAFASLGACIGPTILSVIFEALNWESSFLTLAIIAFIMIVLTVTLIATENKLTLTHKKGNKN